MNQSTGLIDVRQYPEAAIEEILRHADSLMYKDKAEYYYLNPADGRD